MSYGIRTWIAAGICVAALVGAADAAKRRTKTSSAPLAADASLGAKGKVIAKRQEATKKLPVHETLELALSKLDRAQTYTIWMDDPSDEATDLVRIEPYEVVSTSKRTAKVRWDDAAEGLPFGATLATLAGHRLQVRDGAGHVALTGTVPALRM